MLLGSKSNDPTNPFVKLIGHKVGGKNNHHFVVGLRILQAKKVTWSYIFNLKNGGRVMTLHNLPLLHNGDAFSLSLEEVSFRSVRLTRIIRYPNNANGDGIDEPFRDLDHETKHAVIRQINRRHPGKSVLV